jgi:hypothetical protein
MKVRHLFFAATGAMMLFPMASQAHEVPNMPHTHAFEQTGYGTYRQGHTVNNELGSITIYSPQPQTGYQSGKTVRFARPEPITKAPGSPVATTQSQKDPVKDYGKNK